MRVSPLHIAIGALTAVLSAPPSAAADSLQVKSEAQTLALIGHNQLHLARLSDAQNNCDAALKIDPSNAVAKDCLDNAASMLADRDLNDAEAKLQVGDKAGAIALAARWPVGGVQPKQQQRARSILSRAQTITVGDRFKSLISSLFADWLRQALGVVIVITGLALTLLATRKLWKEWERGAWYGNLTNSTKWKMLPLKDVSEDSKEPSGTATDGVLDAFARLGLELGQKLWQPKLLLLRPTPPANHEPAIIDAFLSDSLCDVLLAPAAEDLRLQWQLHDVELDQALQSLQLKTAAGIDVGSIARFVRSIFEWFTADAPTISGVAEIATDKAASIHLFARGGRIRSVAVAASTAWAPGIDAMQLSAERAAFKFLFRMQYPAMTNEQIDGFSALRQGATQFAQYAGTVPGVEDDTRARASSLAHAAYCFGFFRASIPLHFTACSGQEQGPSLKITDEIHQAVLLAEGVAHSLVGSEADYMQAIACFRQLQDWPGSEATLPLRQQAAYNEAIVWRELGSVGQSVLMLTTLLGERTPDTTEAQYEEPKCSLSQALEFPARVARLAAFARYDRNDWSILPVERADFVIEKSEEVIDRLGSLIQDARSAHDRRLATYMYVEALRAIGHVELMRVKMGSASRLYQGWRPTGLRDEALTEDESQAVRRALDRMRECEGLSPNCDLYCDLAESYLLLKEFAHAEGYARHATLKKKPASERAYYLTIESLLLQGTDAARARAIKYAKEFQGDFTMDEFKSVCAELGITPTPRAAALETLAAAQKAGG
jgi:hypothetical protein